MRKVSLWNPWILIPAGVIVIVAGLIVLLQPLSRRKRYTGHAEAEILSVRRTSHHSNGVTRHIYTPTLAYTVDGSRYEAKGQGVGKSDHYVQGAIIPVLYNPDRPDKCLSFTPKESARGAYIAMGLGAGIAALGVLSMLI